MSLDEEIEKRMVEITEEIRQLPDEKIPGMMLDGGEEIKEVISKYEKLYGSLFIEIGGNIAMGKTTTARIIRDRTGMKIVKEDDQDPILNTYYKNRQEWAYPLQIYLITTRLNLIRENRLAGESFVYDRTHYEDPFVFAEALYKTGDLNEEEFSRCLKFFDLLTGYLPEKHKVKISPDLIIYIGGNPQLGKKRMEERGRKMEKSTAEKDGVPDKLYDALDEKYTIFSDKLKELYKGPTIKLNQDEIEISDVKNTKGWIYITESLKETLKLIISNK